MKRAILPTIFLMATLAANTVLADTHSAISRRQAAMKTISEQMKILGNMSRIGSIYDDFLAQSAFENMGDAIIDARINFLQNSQTGEKTRAKASIWRADSDFNARMATFLADVNAAIVAEPPDQGGFTPLFATVSQNCKSCHDVYRAPKN